MKESCGEVNGTQENKWGETDELYTDVKANTKTHISISIQLLRFSHVHKYTKAGWSFNQEAMSDIPVIHEHIINRKKHNILVPYFPLHTLW